MDIVTITALPDWLVWCAAAVAGGLALATLVSTIEAALDLEA